MIILILIAIIITILGIGYILSPIDIIPDFIPFAGWIDDLIVVVIIALIWLLVLGIAILEALFPLIMWGVIIFIIILILRAIFKKPKKKRKKKR